MSSQTWTSIVGLEDEAEPSYELVAAFLDVSRCLMEAARSALFSRLDTLEIYTRLQFYPEDTVVCNDDICIVLRVHTEIDEQALIQFKDDPTVREGPDRALHPGEAQILYSNGQRKSIVKQEQLQLIDRHFVLGDLVRRRDGADPLRGTVLSQSTELQLRGLFDGKLLEGWIPASEVVNATRINRGDLVCAEDWIGVVADVFEEALVASPSGGTFRICDLGSGLLAVGSTSDAILAERMMEGFTPSRDEQFEVVLSNAPICVAVQWFALNQLLPVSEHAFRPRPRRFWSDLSALCLVRASSDHLHSVADKVLFRDPRDAAARHGATQQRADADIAFGVINSKTTVECLWHDGRRQTLSSHEMEQAGPVDEEHEVGVGDLATWESGERVAIVQRTDATARTVEVRWFGTDVNETVSSLELDPLGPGPGSIGVHRGDVVMLLATPSPDFPLVGKLGEPEANFPSEETLLDQMKGFASVQAERVDRTMPRIRVGQETAQINWYAEVIDLTLDGQVVLRFPSGAVTSRAPDRLALFDDGLDAQLNWQDGMMHSMLNGDDDAMSDDSWQSDDGPDQWVSEEPADILLEGPVEVRLDETVKRSDSVMSIHQSKGHGDEWERFAILEEAPADHHFIDKPIQMPSRTFSSRVSKEYNALQSSLPDNILVRAYEDRMDLLRALLIGPTATPYEHTPFVFDIHLSADYPSHAPSVFFHSRTGAGRINPNLYTDGKVCLSLLGTWSGERTESWDPSRSSCYQVLISLQGLVLVKEPCVDPHACFEKQQNTAEGAKASQLYSERCFVLSRAQIRKTLERPPAGFEAALRHYYLPSGLNRLQSVIAQLQRITGQPEENSSTMVDDPSAPWLSDLALGSIISLRKALTALETLSLF